jgi:hypothetical protein
VVVVGVSDDHDLLAAQVLLGHMPKLGRPPQTDSRHVEHGSVKTIAEDEAQHGVRLRRSLDPEVDDLCPLQAIQCPWVNVEPVGDVLAGDLATMLVWAENVLPPVARDVRFALAQRSEGTDEDCHENQADGKERHDPHPILHSPELPAWALLNPGAYETVDGVATSCGIPDSVERTPFFCGNLGAAFGEGPTPQAAPPNALASKQPSGPSGRPLTARRRRYGRTTS